MIKAYHCQEDGMFYSTVVFAETAGKARYIAMCSDTLGEDLEFRDVHVRRLPALDKYYRGQKEMNWDNDADRIAMVKDAGYVCDDDSFDPDECERCIAKEYCSKYEEYAEEAGLPND